MSQSLAVREQQHGMAIFRPQTLAEAIELAGHLAKSDLVPKEYRGKPENVLVAMQLGADVGLSPFQALQSIAVINGRPTVYGDAGLAIVQASGLLEDMDETDDPQTQTATCWMKRRQGRRVERTYSHADAQGVTMYERDSNGNLKQTKLAERAMWRSFPKRMRQMRARWWVMKDLFADVLKGLAGREEIEPGATPIPPTDEVLDASFEHLMPKERPDAPPSPPEVAAAGPGIDPTPETPAPAPAAEAAAAADEAVVAGSPPASTASTTFDINGHQYTTAGITKAQLIDVFKLTPKVDKAKGKDTARTILLNEFQVQTRVDLTEEQAEKYLIRLRECTGDAA